MKKLSFIFMAVFACIISFAAVSFSSMPAPAPNTCYSGAYPVSNKFSRGVQGIFGINFIGRELAESIIKKQITNQIQKGKIKVHVKSYSAGDLIAGKIKNILIEGKNIESSGIFISDIKAESLCDFTWVDYKSKLPMLKSPLYVKYNAEITQSDFQKIFQSDVISSSLKGIKIMSGNFNFGQVDFVNLKPDIKNDKISLKADMIYKKAMFTFNFPINMETAIKVKNDKIFLTNLQFPHNQVNDDLMFLTNSLALNNISIFDLKTLEKDGSKINIKKLQVVNDKISVEGTFWLPQNTKLQ